MAIFRRIMVRYRIAYARIAAGAFVGCMVPAVVPQPVSAMGIANTASARYCASRSAKRWPRY